MTPLLMPEMEAPLTKETATAALSRAKTVSEWNAIRYLLQHLGPDTEGNTKILAAIDAEGLITKVLGTDPI